MKCKDAKTLISSYLVREIADKEKKALEEHLKGCADCQKVLNDNQKIFNILKEDTLIFPTSMHWNKLPERMAYGLLKEKVRPKWAFRSLISGFALATAISVLILFIFKPVKSPPTYLLSPTSNWEETTTDFILQNSYVNEEDYFEIENLEAILPQALEEYLEIYKGGWEYEKT